MKKITLAIFIALFSLATFAQKAKKTDNHDCA